MPPRGPASSWGLMASAYKDVRVKRHVDASVHTRVKSSSNIRNFSLKASKDVFPACGTTDHVLAKLTELCQSG